MPGHDRGDGPPVLVVGEVVLEHGGLELAVEVGVLPRHELVLPQRVVVGGRAAEGVKVLLAEVEDGRVVVRQGVDVGLPEGGRRGLLQHEMEGEGDVGHRLQHGVLRHEAADLGVPGRVHGHHDLAGDADDHVALSAVLLGQQTKP